MYKTNRLQWKRHIASISLISFMALVTGLIMFFMADCMGQEMTNEKLEKEIM